MGAGSSERYGRIACDLSCPNPLPPISVCSGGRVVGQAGFERDADGPFWMTVHDLKLPVFLYLRVVGNNLHSGRFFVTDQLGEHRPD